jgi:CBS domain-containing protein
VRFYEPNEYILWQGEPHRYQVFVIQQGRVSLWNESPEGATLRDVRGSGDMLGIERYNDAPATLYSARSESDVVIYAFPAPDFDAFVLKYPHAERYVTAAGRVTPDYQPAGDRRELSRMFLHDLVARRALPSCRDDESIADASRRLLAARADALIVLDAGQRVHGMLTPDTVLAWVAEGAGSAGLPVGTIVRQAPATVSPDTSVADGLLKMGAADIGALAITDDGTANGRVQALVTRRDLAPLFGDEPTALLRRVHTAADTGELAELNQRARAFALAHLDAASSVEWLARFTHLVDATILGRVAALVGVDGESASWCFAGSSGRAESLTMLAPAVAVVFANDVPDAVARTQYQHVIEALNACGYLPRRDLPFEPGFYAASAGEWTARFAEWVRDPVRHDMHRVRTLFDLRPVYGRQAIWQEVETATSAAVDRGFVHVLANDCLASVPPLTFFQNAVVDSLGEHTSTFRLEHSALRPLVDVGRVFALAGRQPFGRSTIERFATARALLPERDAIFRDAAETFRVVLWQQGRVGIGQGTDGAELPAAMLSRYDRQILKGGFAAILQLLEFTANLEWLTEL